MNSEERKYCLGVLVKATRSELEAARSEIDEIPKFTWLRSPEFGLVMVQARAGGTGAKFNVGEATVTRCALRLDDGTSGYGFVLGRDTHKSELVALFDALLQTSSAAKTVSEQVIARLAAAQLERQQHTRRRAGATKVEFLAMDRGRVGTTQNEND